MRFNIKKMEQSTNITKWDERELIAYFRKRGFKDCTGDVCEGDILWFARDEFGGTRRRPKFLGTFLYRAKVVRESYGKQAGQHTFTVELMKSSTSKTGSGETFRIKGRNLYKHFCMIENADRRDREEKLADKHERGEEARRIAQRRREAKMWGRDIYYDDGEYGWGYDDGYAY